MLRITVVHGVLPLVLAAMIAGGFGCTNRSDVSGVWKGKMTLAETGKSITVLEFDLHQRSQTLVGTMAFTSQVDGNMKLQGTQSNDKVVFTTEHKKGLTVSFTGCLKDRSRIEGTAVLAYSDPKVPVRQDTVTLELTKK